MSRSTALRAGAIGVVAVLLLAAIFLALRPRTDHTTITMQFTDTTGLYVGNDVQTIGVRIGEVTKIEPKGTIVEVTVEVDQPVAPDAKAVIMQSALVTDRFVEITPAWTGGAQLADDAVLGLDRTKSPANVDDIFAAVDDLLVALSDTTSDGKDIGDLLSVSAEQLEGKGKAFAELLDASADALSTLGGTDEDLTAVVEDADSLVSMLAERDATIRSLASSVADASELFAGQRDDIAETIRTLDQLSRKMDDFITDNDTLMTSAVTRASDVLGVFSAQSDAIVDAFNALPLAADNIARAYDPTTRNLRVRLDVRRMAPYGEQFRENLCRAYVPDDLPVCEQIVEANGPFFDQLADVIAGLVDGVIP